MVSKEDIVNFLEDDLAVDVSHIDDDTPLFSSGLVDSFALVSLMTFLEDEGDIQVAVSEANLDNMDSIGKLIRYLETKQAQLEPS